MPTAGKELEAVGPKLNRPTWCASALVTDEVQLHETGPEIANFELTFQLKRQGRDWHLPRIQPPVTEFMRAFSRSSS